MSKSKKIILSCICIVILIMFIILIIITNATNKKNNADKIIQQEKEEKIEVLRNVPESERIKKYIGQYFRNIEQHKYEDAYNLLYPKFREKYFPTLEEYKEYLKKENYPKILAIEYVDIKIKGKNYITQINISDMLNKEFSKIKKEILVQENNYDEFFISFQVK